MAGPEIPGVLASTVDMARAGETVELLVRPGAAHAEEEVDACTDRRRVVRRTLAPDHAWEDGVAVHAER